MSGGSERARERRKGRGMGRVAEDEECPEKERDGRLRAEKTASKKREGRELHHGLGGVGEDESEMLLVLLGERV
eukprot:756685-Hanusia_phi.AAC.3